MCVPVCGAVPNLNLKHGASHVLGRHSVTVSPAPPVLLNVCPCPRVGAVVGTKESAHILVASDQ